jgi:CRISPR-associated protein Cmr1
MQTQTRPSVGQIVNARFTLVTPMFLGGADGQAEGIRPPSLKGALRFWWRALNWGRIRQDHPDDTYALEVLHKQEAALFGASAEEIGGNQVGGQGAFLLTMPPNKLTRQTKGHIHAKFAAHDASRYLGYGLIVPFGRQAGELLRDCIDEKQRFTVNLLFRKEVDSSVLDALIALGLLGGLGSRARHGLGSLTLLELKRGDELLWQAPTSQEAYIQALRKLFAQYPKPKDQPPFSAFSEQSRVDVLIKRDSPYAVLNEFGRGDLMYRSWGRGGIVLGKQSEKRFESDHDWSKYTRPPGFHPRRVIFGLPHNYGKGASLAVSPENVERRASPLLFHVQALGDNAFVGASILLKSDFLPAGEQINAGGTMVPANIEWNILTDFLDGKDKAGNSRFPNKEAV